MARIPYWRTSFGKEEAVYIADSIANKHISQGSVTAEFEDALANVLGVPYVVAVTNGSVALLIALMAIGVGAGDEVIIPNRTWIATGHAPLVLGANVALVDVEADRPIIDTTQIEKKITPRTKAIIPVHLNGRSAAMGEIHRIAREHDLYVIEDACQALGSCNADGLLGTQSDMGCFSLSVSKIISTGQGGFVITRDEAIYQKLKSIRTHGTSDIINASWTRLGFNFRFTDILASMGIVQLKKLENRICNVKAIYSKYKSAIGEMPFLRIIPVDIGAGEIPIYVEVLCTERERLIKYLADHEIETRPFYPDLNLAPYFENTERFPCSEIFDAQGLVLPCGPEQPMENIYFVLDVLYDFGRTL